MTYQKVVKIFSKSLVLNPSKWVHILRSVITVIQFPDPRVWSILSHCWTSSVNDVRFWQQWRGTINIKQPWKIIRTFLYVFLRFFENPKTWLFTFFWVVAHVFSNTDRQSDRNTLKQHLGLACFLFTFSITSNVTGRHRGLKQTLRVGYRSPSLQRMSYLCELLFCEASSIFHRRVWYRALSLRALRCAYSTFGHHLHPRLPLCQISFSVAASVAELARW